MFHVDSACRSCHAAPLLRTCDGCGATAMIVDCGHMAQPRPIAAGRADGREMDRCFCQDCAERADSRGGEAAREEHGATYYTLSIGDLVVCGYGEEADMGHVTDVGETEARIVWGGGNAETLPVDADGDCEMPRNWRDVEVYSAARSREAEAELERRGRPHEADLSGLSLADLLALARGARIKPLAVGGHGEGRIELYAVGEARFARTNGDGFGAEDEGARETVEAAGLDYDAWLA